jgi:hypothetical protein
MAARTSWLYGTIHVNKLEWMMPGPRTIRALMGVDRLALELNLLDPAVLGLDRRPARSQGHRRCRRRCSNAWTASCRPPACPRPWPAAA